MSQDQEDIHVLVGPVIGMVTDSTARILVESSHDCDMRVFLTDIDGQQFVVRKNAQARRPCVFNFSGLAPETYYKVTVNIPTPGLIKSGFRTIPAYWSLRD
eukprot:Trichotokara_eunicae@DN6840_c0_g1_i1.p1